MALPHAMGPYHRRAFWRAWECESGSARSWRVLRKTRQLTSSAAMSALSPAQSLTRQVYHHTLLLI